MPTPTPARLPRWRGFNLPDLYSAPRAQPLRESDFEIVAEWGFNFVRLPLDYRLWTDPSDWRRIRVDGLRDVDRAVEWGQRYDLHVQLNFHRAPGYTVSRSVEPKSLWQDEEALDVCAQHWRMFAARYHARPNTHLSFNLINEPAGVEGDPHRRVVQRLAAVVRDEDSERLIVCDGRHYGRIPPDELVGLNVAAATRGYEPFGLTHYRAGWVDGADRWPRPEYPMPGESRASARDQLHARWIAPWVDLEKRGVGVMVGEFGAYNRTSHRVVLAWMEDVLGLWRDAGWGWALWNLRGAFGVLDSERNDVSYETWRGHRLDRAMLALLQKA